MEARAAMITVGKVISVKHKPPTMGADCGRSMKLINSDKPKIPNTIEGTAARFEMFISIKSVNQFFGANSSKNIAVQTESGTASTKTIKTI